MIRCLIPCLSVLAATQVIQDTQISSAPTTATSQPVILEGRIADDFGRPMPGVTIKLYGGIATRWEIGSAVTDQNGIYRFDPVPTGYLAQNDTGDGEKFPRNGLGMQIQHPTHCSEDHRDWWDFEIPMVPGRYYRDMRLTLGGNLGGVIVGAASKAVAGLDIRVMGTGDLAGSMFYATTDVSGKFIIDRAMHAGHYKIQVNDPEAEYPELSSVTITAGRPEAVVILQRS